MSTNANDTDSADVVEDNMPPDDDTYYPSGDEKEEFIKHRAYVWDLRKSNILGFENLVLTLSAATLAFSLNYLNGLKGTSPVHVEFIIVAWSCLVIAIILILASYLVAINACEADIEIYRLTYHQGKKNLKNKWASITQFCNYGAAISFILGVFFTILFAGMNLRFAKAGNSASKQGAHTMSNHKSLEKAHPTKVGSYDAIKGGHGTKPTPPPPSQPAQSSEPTPKK